MRRRVAVAAFAGFFVIVSVFAAAQERPPGGGESLPSGITALAPSPPAGAPPDAASVARGTVLYETRLSCAPCHGLTGRGGPNNSPDLTRSALAMQPDGGQQPRCLFAGWTSGQRHAAGCLRR